MQSNRKRKHELALIGIHPEERRRGLGRYGSIEKEKHMEKVSEKSVAELAAWAKSPGILRVFQGAIRPRGRVGESMGRMGMVVEATALNRKRAGMRGGMENGIEGSVMMRCEKSDCVDRLAKNTGFFNISEEREMDRVDRVDHVAERGESCAGSTLGMQPLGFG
jgi:hypothetical protein